MNNKLCCAGQVTKSPCHTHWYSESSHCQHETKNLRWSLEPGAFAVASLMVGAVRLRFVPDPDIVFEVINGTSVEIVKPVASPVDFGYEVSPIMLTSTLAMTVGLFQREIKQRRL
uniref:Oxidoreductase n=1 Tax=Loa loa TaxID=7209 RepID=A0A1I7VTI6_LOALO